ncbi:hypothetical protein [Motiliproteus sediminis]|uniref:hypothetical protein n=1 Tax=Motiliproteus sediminis TaxID=1468178 RepID=UPI001AEFE83D|nr:hypothetical protein [Motiliproteus sediminis]
MDAGTIAALIIVGIVVMVGVAFVAQSLENARQERHRQVLALTDHARQLWNSLHGIPPVYLLPELRQFLIAELTRCYRQILTLEPRHPQANGQLKQLNELAQQPGERQIDTLTPAFTDHVSGQQIRTELKHLVNHIVRLHSDGLVDKAQAQQQINLGKALFSLVSIDIGLLTAREMEHGDNAKAALAHYSTCLKHLEKLDPLLQISSRVSYVRNKVEALRAEVTTSAKQTAERPEEEEDEWQKFVGSEQESWKIKQDYE